MTTDTKVGLVVGLAFIVVFAVVLSNRGERSELAPPAIDFAGIDEAIPLLSAESGQPMVDPFAEPTTANAATETPAWIEQSRPTRTADRFQENTPASDSDDGYDELPQAPLRNTLTAAAPTPVQEPMRFTAPPQRPTPHFEEETVAVDVETHDAPTGVETTHEIKTGDSLSKIASAAYGSASPGIVRALAEFNGLKDPGLIQKGQSIRIPPIEALVSGEDQPIRARNDIVAENSTRRTARPEAEAYAEVYTVKAGDTLSRIARNELGLESRWVEILKLNRDRLKNADRLTEGMKLRMPAPSVADAGRRSR